MTSRPTTLGALRASGYADRSVKQEVAANAAARMAQGLPVVQGLVGFDETVLPALETALLAGHDFILLGERGQAKSRILRALVTLLDELVPVVAGSEVNDHPYRPFSSQGRAALARYGDDTPIAWMPREQRFAEKLATPDIAVADLIGDVDPIKVAEGRHLADEETIHFGLVPRHNRGIVAINELPDLAERIQVALLNVMEERDVQIRGYSLRLPLDLLVVATANPEDYTNRGRIITPLKDRFGSQIRTHYPREIATEVGIMEQERQSYTDEGLVTTVPGYMKEILAELSHLARKSSDISQRSGVSVRVTISNYENLVSSALKRALRTGETNIVPRISDLPAVLASTAGKIELETVGDLTEERVVDRLVQRSVLNVFNRTFSLAEFDSLLAAFQRGATMHVSPALPSQEYVKQALQIPGMKGAVAKLGAHGNPAAIAAAVEFVLEGLHLNRKLNKERGEARSTFRA